MTAMRSSYSTLSLATLPYPARTAIAAGPWLTRLPKAASLRPSSLLILTQTLICSPCNARRRVRYDDDDGEEEAYGHNEEIAMLESYSESAQSKALLVRASVDEEEEVVLIFKGFSSCLSGRTSPDPSTSVLPAKAVIKSIDVIKGPFDPSNIEYLEKGLTWEDFMPRLQPKNSF